MGKRAGNARAVGNFMPYGKPAEVTIEYHAPEVLDDGTLIDGVYIEKFEGFTTDSRAKPRAAPDRGDFHDMRCKGRVGVGRVWERDGRDWCHGCYVMRYQEEPTPDILMQVRKAPRRPKQSAFEKFLNEKPHKL